MENDYGWILSGNNWTSENISTVYQTGKDIKASVNNLTGGKGTEWINKYLSDITISKGKYSRGTNIDNNITLPNWWGENSGVFDKYYVAHELAHAWDNETHPGAVLNGGGIADSLNAAIGGSVANTHWQRWINLVPEYDKYIRPITNIPYNDPYIPNNEAFPNNPQSDYGNGCTADYFAEAFSRSIYSGADYRDIVPYGARTWLNVAIQVEAASLP